MTSTAQEMADEVDEEAKLRALGADATGSSESQRQGVGVLVQSFESQVVGHAFIRLTPCFGMTAKTLVEMYIYSIVPWSYAIR